MCQNLAWSFWMSSLTILPATLSLGPILANCSAWKRVFQSRNFHNPHESCLFFGTAALLVGNWMACLVIPLDWGVDWQVWPIPNAMLGSLFYLVASLLTCCRRCSKNMSMVDVDARPRAAKKTASPAKKSTTKSPAKKIAAKEESTPSGRTKRASRSSSKSPKKLATPKKSAAGRGRSVSRTPKKSSTSRSPSMTPRRSSRRH